MCVSDRGVVQVASRQALEDSAAKKMMQGCIQALSNGLAGQSSEVLGLARDVLVIQPPLAGPRAVQTLPLVHVLF